MRDLVEWILDYTAALDACNADKGGVREFYRGLPDSGAAGR